MRCDVVAMFGVLVLTVSLFLNSCTDSENLKMDRGQTEMIIDTAQRLRSVERRCS